MVKEGLLTMPLLKDYAFRSVKYEKLYLYPPKDGIELYQSLAEYFNYYNHERRHSGINNQIPNQKYIQQVKKAA